MFKKTPFLKMTFRFVLRRDRISPQGQAPILCVIRCHGATIMPTGLWVKPSIWQQKPQCAKGNTPSVVKLNEELARIKSDLTGIKNSFYSERGCQPTAKDIIAVFRGELEMSVTLSTLMAEYTAELNQKQRAPGTMARYQRNFAFLLEYLGNNRPVRHVSYNHVKGMHAWLREKGHSNDYANKIVRWCSGLFLYSIRCQYSEKNPFAPIALEWENKLDRTHLTEAEISRIEVVCWNETLQRVVDAYLFLCETGLNIGDYISLRQADIHTVVGMPMIIQQRQKSTRRARANEDMVTKVPLSDRALSIIDKYDGVDRLPRISGQKMNQWLKVVAEKAGIEKNLTNRVARKTMANTFQNVYRFSDETTSASLGHVSTRQLKKYTSVQPERVANEWIEKMKQRSNANSHVGEVRTGVFKVHRRYGN